MGWDQVGQAVEHRIRREIGMTYIEAARRAGIDQSSLWKVRKGHGAEVSDELLGRIEQALRWPKGTISKIRNGGTPPPATLSDPERLEQLEREVAELRESFLRIEEQLRRLATGE